MAFNLGIRTLEQQLDNWGGLTLTDASRLGYGELSRKQCDELGLGNRPGVKMPYFGTDGKDTSFFRVRFLDSLEPKYSQIKGSDPHIYLPPNYDWKSLSDDSCIVLTEGEAKAARACKDGYPCIGLGGVWSFKCTRTGEFEILDELKTAINWKGRRVLIIFDSDIVEKPQVDQALHALAEALSVIGARPETAVLPARPNGAKAGLDDYLGRGDKIEALEVKTFAELRPLFKLNEEYQCVDKPPAIRDLGTGQLHNTDKWLKQIVSARYTVVREVANRKTGETKLVKKKIGPEWMGWGGRNRVTGIGFQPGGPEVLPNGEANPWVGFGTDRAKGIVKVEPVRDDEAVEANWGQLMKSLFGDDAKARHWFESWCAYTFANPGKKTRQAAVIWSPNGGTGKNTTITVLRNVHGMDNSVTVSQKQLNGRWTGWKWAKTFIGANEVNSSDNRLHADALKEIITDERIQIELKGIEEFETDNFGEILFTSNSAKAVWIEREDDRRFWVHKATKPLSPALAEKVTTWSATIAGKAAMLHYFIHFAATHENISGYAPNTAPMMTTAKALMIEAGESGPDSFAKEVVAAARAAAKAEKIITGRSGKELLEFDKLLVRYKDDNAGREINHPGALAASLRKYGAEKIGRARRSHNGAMGEITDEQLSLRPVSGPPTPKDMSTGKISASRACLLR